MFFCSIGRFFALSYRAKVLWQDAHLFNFYENKKKSMKYYKVDNNMPQKQVKINAESRGNYGTIKEAIIMYV